MEDGPLYRNKRFNAVGFCLIGIRIWQWTSSFFVYASFSLLYAHIHKNKLGENSRMKSVQVLGLVSLIYSTVVICFVHIFKTLGQRSWRIFALVSFPGDLTIMGICLAKITILSFSGLPADCHGLTRDNYNGNDLVRQPADGYDTIRFGSWGVETAGELDELCTFPRTVYGLSVVAIFSYTFSIVLSVLYVQQQNPEAADNEKIVPQPTVTSGRNSLEDVERPLVQNTHAPSISHQYATASRMPSLTESTNLQASPPPSWSPPVTTTSSGGSWPPSAPVSPPWSHMSTASSSSSQASNTTSSYHQSISTWGSSTLTSEIEARASDSGSITPRPSAPPRPVSDCFGFPPRRGSMSTNSSQNATAFVTKDECSPESDPPDYSSRPGSLYQESMKYEAGLPLGGFSAM